MFYGQCNVCGERWELETANTCKCPKPDKLVGLTTQEILEIVDNHTEIRGGLPILYRDQAVDLAHSIRDKLQELNR